MRNTPTLNLNPMTILWIWLGVAGMATATLYGVANYNLLENIFVALPPATSNPSHASKHPQLSERSTMVSEKSRGVSPLPG